MVVTVDEFLKAPSLENFLLFRKPDLLTIGKGLKLKVKSSMRKAEIKNIIIQHLVDQEIFEETALDEIVEFKSDEIRLKELDLELKEREIEMKEKEVELELKQKEAEMKEKEIEREMKEKEIEKEMRLKEMEMQMERERLQVRMKELEKEEGGTTENRNVNTREFDVSKNVRLVPPFQEKEVDKYFLHFEKIANSMKWPVDKLTLLLQSVLIGKARDIYSSLSVDQISDYQAVKKAILKAYELVPEAYRQKFRNSKKKEDQTHVEFAREKEQLFARWCESKDIDKNYDKLRQLLLIEEFKRCVHSDIKTHLDERKVDTLNEAAVMADDYSLTHKGSFVKNSNQSKFNSSKSGQSRNSTGSSPSSDKQKVTDKDQSDSKKGQRAGAGSPSGPICNYCKKVGHVMSECYSLQRKEERKKQSVLAMSKSCQIPSEVLESSKVSVEVKSSESDSVLEKYSPFISEGFVSLTSDVVTNPQPVKILRDTGASQSLLLEGIVPLSEKTSSGSSVLLQGVELGFINVPLHCVYLKSDLVTGPVTIGVRPELPVEGVSLILGNDLAGEKVRVDPLVSSTPSQVDAETVDSNVVFKYPSCAVTRSMSKKDSDTVDLCDTFLAHELSDDQSCSVSQDMATDVEASTPNTASTDKMSSPSLSRKELILEQENDPELSPLCDKALTEEEAEQVPVCYFRKSGVLMRKWRPPDVSPEEDWKVVTQIVVPKVYRKEVLSLAHDIPMAGHLGVTKTYNKILDHFFWPKLKHDVAEYCRSCHTCQMVGKPNQKIPVAPLKPIPAFEEPFSRVIIDCVGPLPKTRSGNQYLLTVMCASTRFPEAIPLRNIKAQNIVKALVKFFTLVGLPKSIQSDQGSNFMSGIFQQVMYELKIKQYKSSAYHPESQGALERFHQTLKNMMRTYCLENEKDWDEGLHMLLFAVRESVQESLGFSPFELVFGHSVRGPLMVFRDKLLDDSSEINLLEYVSKFKQRLTRACELAKENLAASQAKMKTWYDKDARERNFQPGDKVLALLPIPGQPLQARYFGPYVVEKKIDNVNYVVQTPGRRKKTQLCHVNMLKEYFDRNEGKNSQPVATLASVPAPCAGTAFDSDVEIGDGVQEIGVKLCNSNVLANLDGKLRHLSNTEKNELKDLIQEYRHLFPDVPGRTDVVYHDVDVGDAKPVKQHPYRVNPLKAEHMEKELKYMLENDIIEPSSSEWSSPCILVPKPDKSFRFCTDFRKVNSLTKSDSYPIPRIDDCIDKVGKAKYVSKFDLLKGYWQVPLTERAKEVSAFVTPKGLFQYKVMAFGMKNAPATFQRLLNNVIKNLDGCDGYIDDVIIYSDTWEEHVQRIRDFFDRLTSMKLTVNLLKCEFCHATVEFLGHTVGQGQIKPVKAKVETILDFPVPRNRRELMRFLGMAGYYRKFCQNFSVITEPLTGLLKKNTKFIWTDKCQGAFEKVKAILSNSPVLSAPNFRKQFKLFVDASDVGVGAVLMQEDDSHVDHPICFFSKKFDKHQKNYSTIEKECLALILALNQFEVYLSTTASPVLVYTDHNPLTFINKMKNKNQRILRWSLTLQGYNLDIRHIKGKDNVIADALSRV